MPSSAPSTVQRVVYEGVLGWQEAAALMAVLAIGMAWVLWRERNITGHLNAVVFYALRLVALGLVVWMLMEPTRQAIERVSVPKTIALLVDGSQSMTVAEPLPAADETRWRLSAQPDGRSDSLCEADCAVVAMNCVGSSLRRAEQAIAEYAPPADVRAALSVAVEAAESAAARLAAAADDFPSAEDTAKQVRRGLVVPLGRLAAAWEDRGPASRDDAADDVLALIEPVDGLLREARALVVQATDKAMAESSSSAGYLSGAESRLSRCLATLERLEDGVLDRLGEAVTVKRVVFEEFATPAAEGQAWTAMLSEQPERSNTWAAAPRSGSASTNVAAALESIGRDAGAESIVATVLLSDGGHNTPNSADPRAVAAGLAGTPVYVTPIGSHEPQRDLQLLRVEAPTAVALRDRFTIEAIVTGRDLEGERVDVELRRDGAVVDRRVIEFSSARQDSRIRFEQPAEELGRHEYELIAPPLDDEASEANNAAAVAVRVVRDSVRLLLADRAPRYEYRYLDQLFRRDKRVKFDKLLFLPELLATGGLERSRELPRSVETWSDYDVLVLGDLEPSALDRQQQESLSEWVRERGGSLVVIAGEENMPGSYGPGPLLDLLPVQAGPRRIAERDGYVPELTVEGRRSETLMLADSSVESARLWIEQYRQAPIYYVSSFSAPKPAAHVWAGVSPARGGFLDSQEEERSVETALFAWQEVGAGRVVYVASPSTWRLRFLRGDELHHRFWGQLLRWLTAAERGKRSARLFVRTDGATYNLGQPIEVTVTLSDSFGAPQRGARLSAVAETLTGESVAAALAEDPLAPGRYTGRFDRLDPGAYRVTAAGPAVDTLPDEELDGENATSLVSVVAPDDLEMGDPRGDLALLRDIAETTGGQLVPPTALAEVLRLSASEPRVVETETNTPLWNRWRYLGLVVGCLMVEWGVRRSIGLV